MITNRAADREAMGEKQLVFAIGFYDKFLAFQNTKKQFSLSLHIFLAYLYHRMEYTSPDLPI